MRRYDRLFIGGEWCKPSNSDSIDIIDSANESVIGSAPVASAADVDKAVMAARRALRSWSETRPEVRAVLLKRLSEILKERAGEVAEIISREVGMPLKLAQRIQAGLPPLVAASYAELLGEFALESTIGNSLVLRVPKGVVATITPWNYPLHQLVAKVAPALAAGCTVVAKPSGEAPLTSFIFAEAVEAAGFPPGVFNLVPGLGAATGEALVRHDGIDMISFTGSTATGVRIALIAGASAKRVTLELGGKSPSVVLDDADFSAAVRASVNSCFLNSGQTCSALTRLLVPKDRLALVEEQVRPLVAAMTLGDPGDPATKLGPLISAKQRDRVRGYIRQGMQSGGRLVIGGDEPPEGLAKGFYVKPTVFVDVDPNSAIAQEEIFGPVLCIIGYSDEDDAVAIANGTRYGLAAAVWSANAERAIGVAKRIRAGQVDINGAAFNLRAPFGGFKQSGYGRELGAWGLEEYLETQSLQLK